MTEETIFLTALDKKDAVERAAYLDAACANDPVLRQRIEALLQSDARAGGFLNAPAVVQEMRREKIEPTITIDSDAGLATPADTLTAGPEARSARKDTDHFSLSFLSPASEPGSLGRLDQYEVLEVVGRGGMGVVLKARDTKLQRIVAVKVMAPLLAANGTARKRFVREAQAAAAVRDEHVVGIYAVCDEGAVPYLVMEFIGGITLGGRIHQGGPLEVKEILRIGVQAARGLAAAHKQGLIHRDITPGNILLENGVQRVKLTDFGLARARDDGSLTQSGHIAGTPLYMSPEQARGEVLDQRSDLFSLGSVLYTMASGRPAFHAGNTLAVMKRVCEEAPRPLSELNPDIPPWLVAIIDRLMAKNPADRFQTATDVADVLGQHLARLQQSGLAGAPSVATASPSRSRPRMVALAGVMLVAMVLIAVAIVAWPRLFPPTQARDDDAPVAKSGSAPKDARDTNGGKPTKDDKILPPVDDPKVLTVSRKAEDGGRLRTINEALDQVQPGMTIRVLDNGTYTEALSLTRPSQFEGLTLESPRGATLEAPPGTKFHISIQTITGLALRGFRLRGDKNVDCFVRVNGRCPGLVLEQLDLDCRDGKETVAGIAFSGVSAGDGDSKILIRKNVFRHMSVAIWIDGCGSNASYQTAFPCQRISIEENDVADCVFGIVTMGSISQVQIVGNKVYWSSRSAIQLENLLPGSSDILVANNSIMEAAWPFRLWDAIPRGENIRISNNLFLGHVDTDMTFWNNQGKQPANEIPGDGPSVLKKWIVGHNWRELKSPETKKRQFIPAGPTDKVLSEIKLLSRQPSNKDFLRPAKDSPLATAGANSTEPALPAYVGAVPPEGATAWDWDRTWKTLVKNKDKQ